LEILTSLQREIINYIKELPDINAFYLTGGTALSAFYLKHRKSNDIDLFTPEEELILPFSFKIEETLKGNGIEVKRSREFNSFVELFVCFLQESTAIHIALDSPFKFEQPADSKRFPGLKIDSLIDIATNKLLTLFGRANLRDFVDVYFLINEIFKKGDLIEKAKIKDPGFDIYWLGVAFERVNAFSTDSQEMLLLKKPFNMKELQGFFNQWREEIYKKITEG
jgi:hypothetical protein